MTKQQIGKLSARVGEQIDYWRKIVSALILFGTVITALWVQFVGDGVREVAQDFLGITEISVRLDELERNVPPPSVVEWNEAMARQRGTCTADRCVYTLNGARTRYGETCGMPTITPFLRNATDGRSMPILFDEENMSEVELTRTPIDFDVHLRIPRHRAEGDYSWAAKLVYPKCPGRGEPIPRWTPWFPLRVTVPSTR